jgi:hypothetical protein
MGTLGVHVSAQYYPRNIIADDSKVFSKIGI